MNYPKIVVVTKGNKISVKMWKERELIAEAEARCSPEDEFNYETGVKLAIERLFETKHCNINIGDKVEVVNHGKAYTQYTKWVIKNCNGKSAYYKYGSVVKNGTVGNVIAITPHMLDDKEILCYIEGDYGCYLISEKGLKKVNK